jgi:hypothetical protein
MTSRLELYEFKQKLQLERIEHAIKRVQAMRQVEARALAKVRALRADLRAKAQKESAE